MAGPYWGPDADGYEISASYEGTLTSFPLIPVTERKTPRNRGWSSLKRSPAELGPWRKRLLNYRGPLAAVTGASHAVLDVDLDVPGAPESFERFCSEILLDVETPTVRTPSGGLHLHFRTDEPLRSGPVPGFVGLDFKCEGGYVLVPPSPGYVWDDQLDLHWPVLWVNGAVSTLLSRKRAPRSPESDEVDPGGTTTADDSALNERTVLLLVERFGAENVVVKNDGTYEVKRPGNTTNTKSATVGAAGVGKVVVFSPNWSLPPDAKGYPGVLRSGLDHAYTYHDLLELLGERPKVDTSKLRTEETPAMDADVIPDGYRLWEPEVDDVHVVPMLDVAAYVGPVGEYLHMIEGRTEAHPAAVGLQVLASLGTLIGRRAVYVAGRLVHHCNLFGAVVGPTALGAKGSADAEAFALVNLVCPSFLHLHGLGGLGSGEVLVRELADRAERWSSDGKKLLEEASTPEKRRIIHSAELSSVLRIVRREGSILGDIVRQAYDYGPLRHHTIGHGKAVAIGHHVALVGSITPAELLALVDELSISNGFLNRFLLVWSERVISLPHGGGVDELATAAIADTIRKAIDDVQDRRPDIGASFLFRFTTAASERWETFYAERRPSIGATEMLRSINARQVAHAARLSLIYAAVSGARYIGLDHLEAAIAWCDYSAMTAEVVFGGAERTVDERVLQTVRRSMPVGIPKTLMHRRLPHGWPAGWVTGTVDDLVEQRLLWIVKDKGGVGSGSGRLTERVVALSHVTPEGRKEGKQR